MCRFISAVLPAGTDPAKLAAVATRYGRDLRPVANPGLQAQLHPGEVLCLTTVGHCDCDSALGAFKDDDATADREGAAAGADATQGVERVEDPAALDQQGEHRRADAAARRAQSQAELQRWREFLGALLDVLP